MMDTAEATQFVWTLFASVPDIPPEMVATAVGSARVADADGRGPLDEDYVDTVDEWLAAAAVAEHLDLSAAITGQGQAPVKQLTSEGATFAFADARTWADVAAMLRSRSSRWQAAAMGVIEVPSGALPFRPRSAGMEWWT